MRRTDSEVKDALSKPSNQPSRCCWCCCCISCCSRAQGIAPEIGRGVLSAALMLMVKEKIHSAVKGAIVGGRTATS